MAFTDTPWGVREWCDDFVRRTIDTTNYYTTNADTGGTAFAINEQHGGAIRGSVDTTDNDITNVFTAPLWSADHSGPLTLEMRCALITSVADGETYIGWTDDDGTDENPITLSTTDVQTSNASNAVGFAYTGGGTANWKAVAVKADVDATPVACNVGGATTPVAGVWQTFKIVLNRDGDARFYINGVEQAVIENAVTKTTLLAASAAIQSGGTARSLDIDYIKVTYGAAD